MQILPIQNKFTEGINCIRFSISLWPHLLLKHEQGSVSTVTVRPPIDRWTPQASSSLHLRTHPCACVCVCGGTSSSNHSRLQGSSRYCIYQHTGKLTFRSQQDRMKNKQGDLNQAILFFNFLFIDDLLLMLELRGYTFRSSLLVVWIARPKASEVCREWRCSDAPVRYFQISRTLKVLYFLLYISCCITYEKCRFFPVWQVTIFTLSLFNGVCCFVFMCKNVNYKKPWTNFKCVIHKILINNAYFILDGLIC